MIYLRPHNLILSIRFYFIFYRADKEGKQGKIELRMTMDTVSQPGSQIGGAMGINMPSMTKALLNQGKMLDDYIQTVEVVKREGLKGSCISGDELIKAVDSYKDKYSEVKKELAAVTKEREALEAQISEIIITESEMELRFNQLVELIQEEVQDANSPLAHKLMQLKKQWSKQQNASDVEYSFPKEIAITEDNKNEIEVKFEDIKSIEEAQEIIGKLLLNNNYVLAADICKKLDYGIGQENKEDALKQLRLICKIRDKQIENLGKEVNNVEILKACLELKNGEMQQRQTSRKF